MHFRPLWCLLACLLLAGAAPPAHADALSPEQKSAVDQLVHDYLMKHPEVIIEALKAAQQDKEERSAERARQAIVEQHARLYTDPDSPVGGNPQGKVSIIEFFDYRCPYCKEVEPSLEALLKEDSDLRIVYKEFPILGPASVYAARVALAARRQGKYDEFHRGMMAKKGKIDEGVVLETAASVGLDIDKLKADLLAPEVGRIIQRDYDLAEALEIQGTPAFIIGDTLVPGVADIATLRRLVRDARQGG